MFLPTHLYAGQTTLNPTFTKGAPLRDALRAVTMGLLARKGGCSPLTTPEGPAAGVAVGRMPGIARASCMGVPEMDIWGTQRESERCRDHDTMDVKPIRGNLP